MLTKTLNGHPSKIDERALDQIDTIFTAHALDCMQQAVEQAVTEHHRLGYPVAIWRDGRVVRLFPDGSTEPVDQSPS